MTELEAEPSAPDDSGVIRRILLSTLLALSTTACLAPGPAYEQRPSVGLSFPVASDYEVDQSLPAGVTGVGNDVSYTGIEVLAAMGTYQLMGPAPRADGTPSPGPTIRRRVARYEARLAKIELEDDLGESIDLLDLSVGARAYTPINAGVAPYVSALGVVSVFEESNGSSLGMQFSLRPGLGVEIDLLRGLALDLGFDYTVPIVAIGPGEVNGEDVETDFRGAVARVGLTYTF